MSHLECKLDELHWELAVSFSDLRSLGRSVHVFRYISEFVIWCRFSQTKGSLEVWIEPFWQTTWCAIHCITTSIPRRILLTDREIQPHNALVAESYGKGNELASSRVVWSTVARKPLVNTIHTQPSVLCPHGRCMTASSTYLASSFWPPGHGLGDNPSWPPQLAASWFWKNTCTLFFRSGVRLDQVLSIITHR
jgi:hypothetical protein